MQRKSCCRLMGTLAVLLITAAVLVDAATVRGRFSVADQAGPVNSESDATAVVWLVPLSGQSAPRADNTKTITRRLTLVQKGKHFDPHVLVVEVGTVVDFPN